LNLEPPSPALPGRVASLHVHPAKAGDALQTVELIHLVVDKGIVEDARYFDRCHRASGRPNRRQVSLIGREQIAEHAAILALQTIAPGIVRANIETTGIDLQRLVGREVEVGEAVLFLYEPRQPCHKMDLICPGLRELMSNSRQGVMAQVVQSGIVRAGDMIRARASSE
jgi:MOSC domain-containing protein YiiM